MENKNSLGVYVSDNTAMVVTAVGHGSSWRIVNSFKVFSHGANQDSDQQATSTALQCSDIAEKLVERKVNFRDAAVAIDGSFFTQHNVHSQFTDAKQIRQTVKFDAEEVLAADVLEKAIAYNINHIGNSGSELAIFTTQRPELKDLLADLQDNKVDPLAMEPDSICLGRFAKAFLRDKKHKSQDTLIVLMSEAKCYFVLPSGTKRTPETRTFLVGKSDRTQMLARQIPLTLTACSHEIDVKNVEIADTTNSVDVDVLKDKLGFEIDSISLTEKLRDLGATELDDPLGIAIALGSAMSIASVQSQRVDFRQDFMPYQGKREAMLSMFKVVSVCLSLVLILFAIYFQMQVSKNNKNTKDLKAKLYNDAVRIVPKSRLRGKESVVNILKRELRAIKDQKSGKLGLESGSIEAKLNSIFEVINATPKGAGLKIQSIDISSRTMRIIGSSTSQANTLKFFDEIKKHTQLIIDERFTKTVGGTNNFRVTMKPATN